ncbi:hypothetical protein Gotur_031182 [Gossypium turneri]
MEHFEDVIINENRKEIKWIWKMESFHKPARMVGPWICRFVEEKKVVESWIWKGIAKLMEILEKISRLTKWVPENGTRAAMLCISWLKQTKRKKNWSPKSSHIAPAGNRTRVCTVAGYYSTTRPLPGIEPGSVPWQGTILPLDHWCFVERRVVAQNEFAVFEVILEDEYAWGYIKNMEFEEFKVRVIDADDCGRKWCHVLDKFY